MQPSQLCAETQRKFKARGSSKSSNNSSPMILSITQRSPEQLQTRPAYASSTRTCGRRFQTFTLKSTGIADGDRVTTFKTYHGTHEGPFLGIAPTHRKIQFETVDVMRVQNGKITDHWGVGNLLSLMRQIGGWTPPP